jgi:glucosamine-phosphate N-acetyltransferase
MVLGAVTLLVEPKFIYSGGRVGHIEDVVVRRDEVNRGIGSSMVKFAVTVARKDFHCTKVILDCSNENMKFYEMIGFSYKDNCMAIIWK